MTSASRTASLLERHTETGAIEAALAVARAGQGAVLFLEGPAGIGKSSLLAAARSEAAGPMRVLSARGSALEDDLAFGLVLQLFAPIVREVREQGDPVYSGPAAQARPLLEGELLGGPASNQQPELGLLHALHWLVANLAEERPLLIAVDDAHWADALSLRFLDYLAHRAAGLSLVLLVAARSGEPAADRAAIAALRSRPDATLLLPPPLSETAVGELVRDRLEDADDAFCLACHRVTAGNPFFLRELLSDALEAEVPPTAEGARRIDRLGIEGIGRSVLARLGKMDPAVRSLAAAVAAAGDGVTMHAAAAVAGLEAEQAEQAADRLAEIEILERSDPLSFVHPIVREVIYADLPNAARARFHLETARVLRAGDAPVDAVAVQLLKSSPGGSEWVVSALREAAAHASDRGANDLAARYLRRALEEGGLGDERGQVLRDLGVAATTAGDPSGAERLLEGIETMDDRAGRGMALMELAGVLGTRGRYGEAARLYQRAATELGALPPEAGGGLALLGETGYAITGSHDPVIRAEAVETLHELAARPDLEASALGRATLAFEALDRFYSARPLDGVLELARRTLEHELGDELGEVGGFRMAGIALILCDRLEEGERASERLLAWSEERGSVVETAGAALMRGLIAFHSGQITNLINHAQTSIAGLSLGWGLGLPSCHAALAFGHIERGELEEAERALRLPGGESAWTHHLLFPLVPETAGYLRLVQGRPQEAIEEFSRAGRMFTERGVVNPALSNLSWRAGEALARRAIGAGEQAESLIAEELELAETFGAPRAIGISLRVAGLIAEGDRRLELLDRSVATLEPTPARLELARSLTELGAAQRRTGDRRRSREPLRRAVEIAQECGAPALRDRAQTELRASGARPRRIQLSGIESLTPSERRVAELAAEGLTNRSIAERLYVTKKTVETHLGHVYQKLDLDSREGLPEALAGPGA